MSTKIGIIAEGLVDHILLPALIERIARDRALYTWPTMPDDLGQIIPLRKRGHGGVLEAVRRLVSYLDSNPPTDHAFFVILLDRRTRPVHSEVKRLISGKQRFVFGTAIEEIEAWWLADRGNTLAWLGLNAEGDGQGGYWDCRYKPEGDPDPKQTLDALTMRSPALDQRYGKGNTELASDFVANFWRASANIAEIELGCPRGFKAFADGTTQALKHEKARQGRLL